VTKEKKANITNYIHWYIITNKCNQSHFRYNRVALS